MRLRLLFSVLAGFYNFHPLFARAEADESPPECSVDVAGINQNMQPDEVSNILRIKGCKAGSIVRMTNIRPSLDRAGGIPGGAGNVFRQLLCEEKAFHIDGPPNGVQSVTCSFKGEDVDLDD